MIGVQSFGKLGYGIILPRNDPLEGVLDQFYLPPPAQAQAQPAQAQAHAQWLPPLLPPPELLPLLVATGMGLVLLVILLVKSPTLPMTLPDTFCTPFTIEAAKSEPGKWGSDRLPPVGIPAVGIEAAGLE